MNGLHSMFVQNAPNILFLLRRFWAFRTPSLDFVPPPLRSSWKFDEQIIMGNVIEENGLLLSHYFPIGSSIFTLINKYLTLVVFFRQTVTQGTLNVLSYTVSIR